MATTEWNGIDRFEETFPEFNCTFLDVLGYKNRVADYFAKNFNLFERINRALDTTATCMNLTAPLLNTSGLTVEIVSDSIIILQPCCGSGLGTLLPFACWLSSTLSFEVPFIRPGAEPIRVMRTSSAPKVQTRPGASRTSLTPAANPHGRPPAPVPS